MFLSMRIKCNFHCYQQSSLSARFLGCLIVTQPQTHASQRLIVFVSPPGLKPEPNAFVKELREMNIFHDAKYAKKKGYDLKDNTLVLP